MLKFKFMMVIFSVLVAFGVHAQDQEVLNINTGDSYMQIALQKELLGILITDSNEVQSEYRQDKTFYTNDNLNQYKEIFSQICTDDPLEKCPEITFTTRDISGIASMYPNGVLAINEGIMNRIDLSESTFVLAHEYAHYKFQHSKQRVKIIAKSVVDNSLMIREPEQALASAGFMPKVSEAHHKYENEADMYGFNYIIEHNIKIDCESMFNRVAGDANVSTDKHGSISDRCKNYKG